MTHKAQMLATVQNLILKSIEGFLTGLQTILRHAEFIHLQTYITHVVGIHNENKQTVLNDFDVLNV